MPGGLAKDPLLIDSRCNKCIFCSKGGLFFPLPIDDMYEPESARMISFRFVFLLNESLVILFKVLDDSWPYMLLLYNECFFLFGDLPRLVTLFRLLAVHGRHVVMVCSKVIILSILVALLDFRSS